MRIIAESQPASFVPYIHLGYLAASTLKPHSGLLNVGIVLLVAGVAMTTRLARGKSKKGRNETHVKLRRGRIVRYGIPLVVLGVLLLYGSRQFGRSHYRHGELMTRMRMRDVYRTLYLTRNVDGEPADALLHGARISLPDTPGAYTLDAIYDPGQKRDTLDIWRTPMQLRAEETTDGMQYTIISAGPDTAWDTEDDLSSAPHEAQWKEEFAWELERFKGE